MQRPVEVVFRNMPHSAEVEEDIRRRVDNLEQYFAQITGCQVIVDVSHRRQRQGNLYSVRIHLSVPRRELVVDRDPGRGHAHEDVHVALRDAFDRARRQLEDYVRAMRGAIKQHEAPTRGRITRLFDDYGFLETSDGREIYFHQHSVLGEPFDALRAGQQVEFVEEAGDQGPQAASLWPVGRHHPLSI
jgi:cold shock CspA family protein/ribosome-associated translation inhibitor RaiA